MSEFVDVLSSLIYAAAFIACLWWGNSVLDELDVPRRFNLSVSVRLFAVLVVGNLVYYPIVRVLGGFLGILQGYNSGWERAAELIGAISLLVFVWWLYRRFTVEQQR